MTRAPFAFTNAYAGNPLDRVSERRSSPDWLAERVIRASSRAYAIWRGDPLVIETEDGGVKLAELAPDMAMGAAGPDSPPLFLGLDGEAAVFAVEFSGEADPAAGPLAGLGRFIGLRDATPLLSVEDAAVAATARAMFEWRRRCRFCGQCGHVTEELDGGWRRHCPGCETQHFPRTDPVVIMLALRDGRCLLGRAASWAPGRFSALAGFLEPGESIEEACTREIREECGLTVTAVRYHSSQPWPYPANLMIGLFAEVAEGEAAPDQTELEAVRWFTRDEARALLAGELDGLSAAPPLAIAHQLLHAWIAG